MLAAGATRKQCAEHFGAKPGAIDQCVYRAKRNGSMAKIEQRQQQSARLAIAVIEGGTPHSKQSDRIRMKLAEELENQIDVLRTCPATNIGELKGRDGRASIVRSLSETADTVFDWSSHSVTGVIVAAALPEPPAEGASSAKAIDVQVETSLAAPPAEAVDAA